MLKAILIIVVIIAIVILLFRIFGQPKFSFIVAQEFFEQGSQKSLYDRLGGIFPIAAVVNYFSDSLIDNPVVGRNSKNPALRDWHTNKLDRLPGLKWMRTLWLASLAGGPYKYVPTAPGKCPFSLENAHSKLHISPEEFDAVAGELVKALDHFKVPPQEKGEVLAAFAAHKGEVNMGYYTAVGQEAPAIKC